MYSDGQVIRDCESMIVTCTGPATATACRFLSRRVQRPVAAGCDCTPKYPCLFRGAALILSVASFLDGATACRYTPPLRGARAENSSSRMGLSQTYIRNTDIQTNKHTDQQKFLQCTQTDTLTHGHASRKLKKLTH